MQNLFLSVGGALGEEWGGVGEAQPLVSFLMRPSLMLATPEL